MPLDAFDETKTGAFWPTQRRSAVVRFVAKELAFPIRPRPWRKAIQPCVPWG
jgi:hypothetical protein